MERFADRFVESLPARAAPAAAAGGPKEGP